MTKVIAAYRGPFTIPRRQIVDQSDRSLIIGDGCSLNDRLFYLARTGSKLTACQNLPELQERIVDLAFKNFVFVGKSVVFAGFWRTEKFIALTIPENLPPLPQNVGRYMSTGGDPSFPIEPELIQVALETMDIVPGGSSDEKFLAMALVSNDRSTVLGVLLLSNRLSNGRKEFTPDDIEIFRTLGEIASEAISGLLPPQSPLRSLS